MSSDEYDDSDLESPGPSKRQKVRYQQKYNIRWEQKFSWISESSKGKTLFYCKCCRDDYVGGVTEATRHEQSKKHQTKLKSSKTQRSASSFFSVNSDHDNQVQTGEIRIAAFIAEHNLPIVVADHIPQLIQSICPDSKIAKSICCGKTKCTGIIKNVLGNYKFTEVVNLLQKQKFSLLVDESTDKGTTKHLALVVRLLQTNITVDLFLTLIPIIDASSLHLYQAIKKFFNDQNIPYSQNMIGFAADGANVMMGGNQSVAKYITDEIPNIFILKCSCHSFALCASYACKKLPESVETLVREVYKYFKYSTKKAGHFKEFQVFCNNKPHKMLQPSQTRWLSLVAVVKRVLEQWDALKLFFQNEVIEDPRNELAKLINEKMQNIFCKLYLQFLDFILPYATDLNKEMQSEKPKICKLYCSIETVYKVVLQFFIKDAVYEKNRDVFYKIDIYNPHNLKSIDDVDLGATVMVYILRHPDVPTSELNKFKLSCLAFYQELMQQISDRFPFENNKLKYLSSLIPTNIKNKKNMSFAALINHFPIVGENNVNELDREWKKLLNMSESELDFTDDFEQFWINVSLLKNNNDEMMFPLLVKLVNHIRILPHSTATVERIFSAINLNKTKTRSSLNTDTLCGMLHTKSFFKNANEVCHNFPIEKELLKNAKKWKNVERDIDD
ncbi:uncharacterized protein LOC115888841 [Sitophilus oryzae]|uniref:Uncharacterized protein LOC115882366 n=1 Tax=Sitophilus oryzae TaxID=7048 RepID=A0A6J2YKK8_SITOR|nr:uncharacterized protein LOC115882366 [Sitophilus oryzae]XP_030764550.1 uncharacterized protein LOC115888832 [Sitophilus oryzae]XP_030764558.1 uncharacterized protein LOC115888841 [Sitophilus oryzae]